MHVDRKLLVRLVAAAIASAALACATVADLEVTRDPATSGPPVDVDDAATGPSAGDAQTSDGGSGTDAPADSFSPPSACACPSEQACCVPKNGAGMCTPATAAGACTAGNGLFIRCAGSDIANGRVCCFTSAGTTTYYASSCDADAGPQVCSDNAECSQGTCESILCRGITLKVCAAAAGPTSPCPL